MPMVVVVGAEAGITLMAAVAAVEELQLLVLLVQEMLVGLGVILTLKVLGQETV